MISYSEIDPKKKAFVFEMDNVLFPEKDYLLQVYYLFANFLEYIEAFPPAADVTNFFKKVYENHGSPLIFDKAREVFGFEEKYRENFERLHREAKLPLKLLLYKESLSFLQEVVVDRKEILILTGGDPLQQLNKIRQIEWNGLEKYLRVYFTDEIAPKPSAEALLYVLAQHQLNAEDVVFLGATELDSQFAKNAEIDFINVKYS
ncbi:HAD hydrolase-like protein [Desertivirga arenae]|uniref:HAD hydrolase-like protein n=1 Tax=Desertivirga arenae TaxID=2810309 RepID=UPI001A96B3D8|nr:HAD hydrolase-like protein [Pedobacter sp. SYSU D00823]